MRGNTEFAEVYTLEPGQTLLDLPAHVREVLLPNSRVERVVTTYADNQSIFRFHIVQKKVETYGY